MNGWGGWCCVVLHATSHLPGVQVREFVGGGGKEGVKDGNGMKEGLGGETNCGTQLSLVLQWLGRLIVIFDWWYVRGSHCISSAREERTMLISHRNRQNNNQQYMQLRRCNKAMAWWRMESGYWVRAAAVEQLPCGNQRSMLDTVAEEHQCMAADEQQEGAGNNVQQLKTRQLWQNNNQLHSDLK